MVSGVIMRTVLPIMLLISLFLLSSCSSTAEISVSEYRDYINNLRLSIESAGKGSFAPNEKEAVMQFSGQILQLVGNIGSFEQLSTEQKNSFGLLNQRIYLVMNGEDGLNCRDELNASNGVRSCAQLVQQIAPNSDTERPGMDLISLG